MRCYCCDELYYKIYKKVPYCKECLDVIKETIRDDRDRTTHDDTPDLPLLWTRRMPDSVEEREQLLSLMRGEEDREKYDYYDDN